MSKHLNSRMVSVGGFLELELPQGREMYGELIALNSARNALVYLIKAKSISSILLPVYCCAVVQNAIRKFCPETTIQFYHVDSKFVPIVKGTPSADAIYRINYYGLVGQPEWNANSLPLILDNAQAFFEPVDSSADGIYCPRKFFGVADGAYLRTKSIFPGRLQRDISWPGTIHLLKRIDRGAEASYELFRKSESRLDGRPLRKMSRLTQRILSSVDYESVQAARKGNFSTLHQALASSNQLRDLIDKAIATDSFVPVCYPYMTSDAARLKQWLIKHRVYVPTYWPELNEVEGLNPFERQFVNEIVCLPVDQRYSQKDMINVIECVANLADGNELVEKNH